MIRNYQVPVKRISFSKHHFFGYYDKCPWSPNNDYMLALESEFADHFPAGEVAYITLIDLKNNELTRLIPTKAWNWQQGAMLHWHPSLHNTILFNDRIENQFVSIQYNINTGIKKIYHRPIAAINHTGTQILSLNFARLYNVRRDYGYAGINDPWEKSPHPEDDGIYSLDMNTGEHRLLVSTSQVANYEPQSSFHGVRHWINHIAFNTDDSRFCFLHRYEIPHLNRFSTRLFTANSDGSNLRCLWKNHVSHYDWRDSGTILAWALRQNSSSRLSKAKQLCMQFLKKNEGLYRKLKMIPFLRTRVYGGAFFLFHDVKRSAHIYDIVGKDVLTEDGHCSYSPSRKWILMDTYPDMHNLRHVILYHVETNTHFEIGRFFSPPILKPELRCDLHARWDRTGTQICIDSMHEGSRQMYILDASMIVQ